MGFVEAMADRGLPAATARSGRSSRCRSRGSPSTRSWNGTAATSRTSGSGWSSSTWRRALVDERVGRRPASGSSTTRSRPAAGSRRSSPPVSAARPGREIDELTERGPAVRGQGPRPCRRPRPMARSARRSPSSSAEDRLDRIVAAAGAEAGDLDPHRGRRPGVDGRRPRPAAGRARRRAARPGRPRRPGLLLGPPLPDVPVGRGGRALGRDPQPVQRGRARGRGAAHDPRRRPVEAVARGSGRPGPGAPVRHRPQRLGARRRHRSGSIDASSSSGASPSRARPTTGCGRSSARCSTRSSTARRRTAGSPSGSIAGR